MREEAFLWLKQANNDLKYAQSNLDAGVYYVCAFLSQQAAEKALKALYIQSKRKVPMKTHNLVELGKELKLPDHMIKDLRKINPAFVTARYPDAANGVPAEMFDQDIAKEHIEKAREVVEWVKQTIK